jgi:hypothetical protein
MPQKSRDRKRRNRALRVGFGHNPETIDPGARFARDWGLKIERFDVFAVVLAITTTENPSANDVVANGTGSLVHTGRKELLITNHHVYNTFLLRREENPHTKLIMSGAHGTNFLDISNAEVLGFDKEAELAVIHMPGRYVVPRGKAFLRPETWPPRRPDVGMLAFFVGYPGEGRRVQQGGALGVSALTAGMRIVSVSERHFVVADESQDAHMFVPEGQKPLTNFGGISGSAVYAMRPNGTTADDVWLCGFQYEEGIGHTLMVAHADRVNADGTIR